MATILWGKVYYQDTYAGRLQQEPGGRCSFTYDPSYLESGSLNCPAISFLLPLGSQPITCESGLHPFFDNLIAEGWLQNAQMRALKVNPKDRFSLLLGFGHDLAGAVSVVDPEPRQSKILEHTDAVTEAVPLSRASLSGVQRKLLMVKEGKTYRPVRGNELSTHIAKFPSDKLQDILELEYLTMKAVSALLPDDVVAKTEISDIPLLQQPALIVERFDRKIVSKTAEPKRLHFEEFNQLLGRFSGDDKYDGSYEDMGQFICHTPGCLKSEAARLYERILACLLVGNTDAHFKNFAMFHTRDGLRLTPSYDLVAAATYKQYRTIALGLGGTRDLDIGLLKEKQLINLAQGFELNDKTITNSVEAIGARLEIAKSTIAASEIGTSILKNQLIDMMEKRWNGSFTSIGQLLSKRQSKGGNRKKLLKKD